MATANKYGARPVFWNIQSRSVISKETADSQRQGKRRQLPNSIVRFDSTLEFNVYLKLVSFYGAARVHRQVPVEIIPRGTCYPNGKTWRVDFGIVRPCGRLPYCKYVEAKGKITPEFKNLLPILEQINPDAFNKLTLVFGSQIPIANRVIANMIGGGFKKRIYTFKQFNQLEKIS